MSSMLEQAIVDAAALREAAIQSAEQVVVEKFSDQIKETVEQLLEQEESGVEATAFGADAPDDADMKFSQKTGGLEKQTLQAHHPEADDDVMLEIDLSNLDFDENEFGLGKNKITPVEKDSVVMSESDKAPEENKDAAVEISENILEELAETLKMDWQPVPDGGFGNGQMRPAGAWEDKEEMVAEIAAAIQEYAEEQETKNKKIKNENKQLNKQNNYLKQKLKEILEGKKELFEAISTLKAKFEKVQLMNAKLHYTNRALTDDSINERQKNHIVESIGKVSSFEQAKIVFETLQSAVGISEKKEPESLSEAVSKRNSSSILIHSRKERKNENKVDNDFARRMRALAGINNK